MAAYKKNCIWNCVGWVFLHFWFDNSFFVIFYLILISKLQALVLKIFQKQFKDGPKYLERIALLVLLFRLKFLVHGNKKTGVFLFFGTHEAG